MTSAYQHPGLTLPGLKTADGIRYAQANSRMGVTIYPQKDDLFSSRSTGAIDLDWRRKTTKGSVTVFAYQKTLGAAAGTWNLSIKDTPPYVLDVAGGDILPGDWADLFVIRNGIRFPVCRGMIDSVRESTRSSGGATVRTWNLVGKDHGGIMMYPLTYQSLWVRTLEELVAGLMTQRVQGSIGGRPSEMFKLLINAALAPGTRASQFTLPPAMYKAPGSQASGTVDPIAGFMSLLKIHNTTPTRGAYYNEQMLWNHPGEGISETINRWCNPLFNEQIYDLDYPTSFPEQGVINSTVGATIRERPFVLTDESLMYSTPAFPGEKIGTGMDSPWFKLPIRTLPSWILTGRDLGRNNHSRFNIVELLADAGLLSQKEQAAVAPPRWDSDSIMRHGLRPFQKSTVFVNEGNGGQAEWATRRKQWQRILTDWHCMNPYFRDGTIAVKLPIPEIRVGQRLRINTGVAAQQETFYVEGVSLNGQVVGGNPSWNTSFTVTRGYRGSDRQLLADTTKMSGKFKAVF